MRFLDGGQSILGRLSDHELVRSAQGGAPNAFAELVTRHRQYMFRLALRTTGNLHDAEEVVQDTLIVLHRRLPSFRGESKFSSWLYTVTRNAALLHLRQRRARSPWQEELPARDHADEQSEECLSQRQLARTALAELAALPDEYRIPFVLRDLEGLSSHETAAAVGITVNLVRQRIFRARQMLRGRLHAQLGSAVRRGEM